MSAIDQNPLDAIDWPALRESTKSLGTVLTPEFMRAVERLENLPENRDGADKSWVWRAREDFRLHFARARRIS